jgi:integrase
MRLPIRKKPYFEAIAPRVGIGYRRNQGCGTWIARGSAGRNGYWIKVIAHADDHEDADGNQILNFWQAQDRCRATVRNSYGYGERPITVGEAIAAYERDLLSRTGSAANARRIRRYLPPQLAAKTVSLLSGKILRDWRDQMLAAGLKPSTVDRTVKMMKAALSLASKDDPRITNASAWKVGLPRLPDQELPPKRIIDDATVKMIVASAYAYDKSFGLLTEVLATTGARASQALRLVVADLKDDNGAPQLFMPSSHKGRRRRVTRTPVPIPAELARRLRQAARGRQPGDLLLDQSDRTTGRMFRRMAAKIGLDSGVTLYSLRHSSIVRQLIAAVPARIVAAGHDTSIVVLESVYSRFITDVSDAVVRRALIDVGDRE